MGKQNHIHSFKKVKYGKGYVFRCTKIGCGSFFRPEFIDGREAECPYCHEVFIIRAAEKRMKFPHCSACRERMREKYFKYKSEAADRDIPKVRTADEIADLFKNKFGG